MNNPWGAMYPGTAGSGPPASSSGNPVGTFPYDDQAAMAAAMAGHWTPQDWTNNLTHYYNYGPTSTSEIPYPSDPCPSTSITSQTSSSSTKSSPQTPQTPTIPPMYYPPEYYGGAMNLNICDNWKMSTVKKKGLMPTQTVPYRTGPGTNNVRVRTAEKYRAVYNEYQRLELEKEYLTNNFISSERKAVLSTELHLTERQIKIWFQNRRAKQRREDSRKH
uniref:Homeobox domain-containing protein n=1 Tax=Steinernema glaseri TaxID=37863 RepID=A0A1I7ZUU7_9BILA